MKLLKLEFYKLRRKNMLLTMAIFLAIELLWVIWAVKSFTGRHGLDMGWEDMMYNITMMNCLFMPTLIAILTSRISDMEHKGETFKLLFTQLAPKQLYGVKFWCAAILLVPLVIGQTAGMIAIGKMFHFSKSIPVQQLLLFILSTFTVDVCIAAMQLWVALVWPNQMTALILGLAGSFLGIMSNFFPSGISRLFLWSYYAQTSVVLPQFNGENNTFLLFFKPMPLMPLIIIIAAGMIFYSIGTIHFSRKEL